MMKNSKIAKLSLCVISFFIGTVFGYIVRYAQINFKIIDISSILRAELTTLASSFFNFVPDPSFLSDIAAFEGVLIGVATPIALQVVSRTADRYNDNEIARIFTDEILYRCQYFLLLPNIAIAISLRFFDIDNSLILGAILIWLLINIVVFYKFIKLVEQYVTNTDEIVLKKLNTHVENIFKN